MGKRSSSTWRRTGFQFGKPALVLISAMKGSGTARSQEEWLPTTFCFCGAREGPRHGCTTDGALCLRRHEICFHIRQEASFRYGYGRKHQQVFVLCQRDGPEMCAISDDALKNDSKRNMGGRKNEYFTCRNQRALKFSRHRGRK